MVTLGSKRPRLRRPKSELDASKRHSTIQWVTSPMLRPIIHTVYGTNTFIHWWKLSGAIFSNLGSQGRLEKPRIEPAIFQLVAIRDPLYLQPPNLRPVGCHSATSTQGLSDDTVQFQPLDNSTLKFGGVVFTSLRAHKSQLPVKNSIPLTGASQMKSPEIISASSGCLLLHWEQCHCTRRWLTEINAGQTLMTA